MKTLPLRLLLPLLLIGACATTPPLPAGQAIGESIKARSVVAFSVVDADPAPFFDRVVLVEASVGAVCQSSGCWLQVEDGEGTAMVRWETGCGGKYAFPSDLKGKRVLVQGTFYPKTLTEDEIIHLEVESGDTVKVEREGYEFNATAILVLD